MIMLAPVRIVGQILVVPLVSIVILTLALILINLVDEDLDPAARALIALQPAPPPEAENAYYAQWALGVPAGQDPHAVGVEYVRALDAVYADGFLPAPDRLDALDRRFALKALEFQGSPDKLCERDRRDCLAAYVSKRGEIERLRQRNAERLKRYRSLYRYAQYHEAGIQRLNGRLPTLPWAEQRLVLASIALRADAGEVEAALGELVRDTGYWRRVLTGSRTLIGKLMAGAVLERNYLLLSEILYRYRDSMKDFVGGASSPARHRPSLPPAGQDAPPTSTSIEAMLTELNPAAFSMREALRTEAHMIVGMMAEIDGPMRWGDIEGQGTEPGRFATVLETLFFKRRASANLYAASWSPLIEVGSVPANGLRAAVEAARPEHEQLTQIFRWDMAYNPIGKILVAVGVIPPATIARYAARLHNLDGLMRLTALQYDIYRKRLRPDGIAAFLAAGPAHRHDPYRDAPMQWDRETGELYFMGADRRGITFDLDRRIGVKIL